VLRLAVTLVFILGAVGCVRHDGRNPDCSWPPENANPTATARHLSEDAEFAEDLAIRYADTHHGLRTPRDAIRTLPVYANDHAADVVK
jgi:hypothetical protein